MTENVKPDAVSVVEGVASKRQRYLLILAQRAAERGITVADVRDTSLHHGRVSGALSALHKAGRLARLTETRDKCHVYVLPYYVKGRETQGQRVTHRADKATLDAATYVEKRIEMREDMEALFDIPASDTEYLDAVKQLVRYAKGER